MSDPLRGPVYVQGSKLGVNLFVNRHEIVELKTSLVLRRCVRWNSASSCEKECVGAIGGDVILENIPKFLITLESFTANLITVHTAC
jgi:hypothetical protein